jgi:hypothetical protein
MRKVSIAAALISACFALPSLALAQGGGGGGGGSADFGSGGGGGGGSYLDAAFTNTSVSGGVNSGDGFATINPVTVPEPVSSALVVLGLFTIPIARRLRRRAIP